MMSPSEIQKVVHENAEFWENFDKKYALDAGTEDKMSELDVGIDDLMKDVLELQGLIDEAQGVAKKNEEDEEEVEKENSTEDEATNEKAQTGDK